MEFEQSVLVKREDVAKLLSSETVYKQQMTLHCQQCKSILADSRGVSGELKSLESIMCTKVTDGVIVSKMMTSGNKGEMSNCIYSSLKCRNCHCALGRVLHSTPPRLAVARFFFLLNKANISCYILDSCSMVKALAVSFDVKPLQESLNEMKKEFEAQLDQMCHIKRRLADIRVSSTLDK
ncbi:protein Mis18-beta [Pholidichthys leucotaenia]